MSQPTPQEEAAAAGIGIRNMQRRAEQAERSLFDARKLVTALRDEKDRDNDAHAKDIADLQKQLATSEERISDLCRRAEHPSDLEDNLMRQIAELTRQRDEAQEIAKIRHEAMRTLGYSGPPITQRNSIRIQNEGIPSINDVELIKRGEFQKMKEQRDEALAHNSQLQAQIENANDTIRKLMDYPADEEKAKHERLLTVLEGIRTLLDLAD